MAYAMTKRGSQDNVITYEFICDTISDMNAIENKYRTLGTIAIVLSGESEGLEVYIAGSNKSWNSLSTVGAADPASAGGLSIYICSQNEVSSGLPNVSEPDESTIYLVGSGNTSGNLYEEYIYVDGAWEKFGAASIDLSNYVQKTDIATQSAAGLVKVLDNGNVTFNEYNQLVLTLAGTAVVKSGQSDHPISVTHQHEAAFYGLAKAAGQDMKNSNNAVGTYTTEAATAIRNMIGAGTYNKPSDGIPASDIANGVIPDTSIYAPKANPEFTGSITLGGRNSTSSIGDRSMTIGSNNSAAGEYSVAIGSNCSSGAAYGLAVGYCTSSGDQRGQIVFGSGNSKYNRSNKIMIAGNGTGSADSQRSNAYALDTSGNGYYAGDIYIKCSKSSTGGTKVATINDLPPLTTSPVTLEFGSLTVGDDNNVPTTTLDVTNLYEGAATLFIGEDAIPVHMSATTDDLTDKTYYMTTEMLQDGTTPKFAVQYTGEPSTSKTVSYMAYSDTTYAEPQTIKLVYDSIPAKLSTIVPEIYVGSANDGTGGTKVATVSQIPDTSLLAPKDSPEFTGSISMGRTNNTKIGTNSIALGDAVRATEAESFASGRYTEALASMAFSIGQNSIASGITSFAANNGTQASAYGSFATGNHSQAQGEYSVAQNSYTIATGDNQTVMGANNIQDTYTTPDWVAGTSYIIGNRVHQGTRYYQCIENNSDNTFNSDHWKIIDNIRKYALIVGNGCSTLSNYRSNAYALDWDGNGHYEGDIYVNCNSDSTGGSKVATEAFVTARVPAPPVADGTYNLQVSVSSGTTTYSWVSTGA